MGRVHCAPLGSNGPGPNRPPWVPMGWALMGPLGPNGPGNNGPPLAIVRWALVRPWTLMGQAQMARGPECAPSN